MKEANKKAIGTEYLLKERTRAYPITVNTAESTTSLEYISCEVRLLGCDAGRVKFIYPAQP
jgi:hypothetical protein